MNPAELLDLGLRYQSQGRPDLAIAMWQESLRVDPNFGAAHLNMHNVYRLQGNLPLAKKSLQDFLSCYQTGHTLEMVPRARTEIQAIDQQLQQAQQPPQPPPQTPK